MIKGIHILLTYTCTFQCDHCFLYSSPRSVGVFDVASLERLIDQATAVATVETICFEGGEPLLYLPQLLAGIRYAKKCGFKTGIVTNAYVARSLEDARLLLSMFEDAGLDSIAVSDDRLHFGDLQETPAKFLIEAADSIQWPVNSIAVNEPCAESPTGSVMFRGRAADRMTAGVPRRLWRVFDECPTENPREPGRVHIDPFGNVLFCQGISMGNAWETPLATLFANWDPATHPVCGPILDGGPAALATRYGAYDDETYVDACHLCFDVRRRLLDRFPRYLTPPAVYGR
jgi:hypothetical protein